MMNDTSEKREAKSESAWEQPGKLLDVLAKLLLAVSTACYVTGIIVFNVQLSIYGYYSLSLLQINYIFAGIWALAPIALCFITIGFGSLLSKQLSGRLNQNTSVSYRLLGKTFNTLLVRTIEPIGIIYYTLILLGGLVGVIWLGLSLAGIHLSLAWLWVFLGAAYIADGIEKLAQLISHADRQLTGKIAAVSMQTALLAAILLIYVSSFGRFIYGEIPQNFGGGQPKLVRIVIGSDDTSYLQTIGFSFTDRTAPSNSVQLLIDTDKEIVFLINGAAVRISRELVKAVIYEHTP